MSIMRRAFLAATVAVSALTYNTVSHAATPTQEGQPKNRDIRVDISKRDINCLARNIFHEARGEPEKGKALVGIVTINRLQDGRFGNSLCGVINQPRQFSWVREKPPAPAKDDPAWIESKRVAQELTLNNGYNYLRRKYQDVLYFHSGPRPVWFKEKKYIDCVGGHKFYKDRYF